MITVVAFLILASLAVFSFIAEDIRNYNAPISWKLDLIGLLALGLIIAMMVFSNTTYT